MKKFLSTVIAILLFNSNAFAEWSIWYAPDKADFYIDKTRTVINKQTIKFWMLTNLKTPQPSH